jgi:glutamate racemase
LSIHQKKKYQTILILSTSLTARIRWHARILKLNIKYMTFDLLPFDIDNNNLNNIHKTLEKLSIHKHFLPICDCVVLGCTHFNVIKNNISECLKRNNFTGEMIDSNYVLSEYFKKEITQD